MATTPFDNWRSQVAAKRTELAAAQVLLDDANERWSSAHAEAARLIDAQFSEERNAAIGAVEQLKRELAELVGTL